MPFSDYPATPSSVTTVGDDIYVGPNMARGDVREALQQLAADGRLLADEVATLALGATGATFYTTIAAGVAATAVGDLFSSNEGGNLTIYRHIAAPPYYEVIHEFPSYGDIDSFTQSGTGAVARDLQTKLRDIISPEDFGAVGDGVTNDTTAIQAAFNTGRSVAFTSGRSYKITSTVNFTADGQKAFFNGCSIIGVGNFDVFKITGGLHSCAISDPVFEGALMTGGYFINVTTADRTTISGVRAHDPYNLLYVEKANLVQCQDWWINNLRGAYGIHWFGNASKRSDVLQLIGITMSSAHVATGILWDGNCHTLAMQAVRLVSCNVGLQVQNTSGGPVPAFLLADGLEIDFPQSHGVDLLVGEDFYFSPLFYCHGSATGSGIRINAAVPHDRVIIAGGKITGHALYGIANPSTRVKGGHFVSFSNTSGDVQGDIYLRSERLEVDDQFYSTLSVSNPIINWDTGDNDLYNRASNIRSFTINSVARLQIANATNAISIWINGALKTIEVGAADSGGVGYRMLRVLN